MYTLDNAVDSAGAPSVLFFGRKNCSNTDTVLRHLSECGFRVSYVLSEARGESLPEDVKTWNGDYILCFRSLLFLPNSLTDKSKVAAINFHPGPPEYPGSGCINFALYDGCESYGVTAHMMNEKIDNGEILECRRFRVHKDDDLISTLNKTHKELTNICIYFISQLLSDGQDFLNKKRMASKNIRWCGEARKISELEELQEIAPSISESELERIIRATYVEEYPPKITLHGYEFRLTSDQKMVKSRYL